jgi:hypothetical protein
MIKIYLGNLDSILMSLQTLINKELPIKISYSLSKLEKTLENEYKLLIEKKNELINKYAERDEKNKVVLLEPDEFGRQEIKIKEGLKEESLAKLNELYNIEVEINFEPISIDLLGDISISPKDLLVLDKFIKG